VYGKQLPAKLLHYFLRSNESNINQSSLVHVCTVCHEFVSSVSCISVACLITYVSLIKKDVTHAFGVMTRHATMERVGDVETERGGCTRVKTAMKCSTKRMDDVVQRS